MLNPSEGPKSVQAQLFIQKPFLCLSISLENPVLTSISEHAMGWWFSGVVYNPQGNYPPLFLVPGRAVITLPHRAEHNKTKPFINSIQWSPKILHRIAVCVTGTMQKVNRKQKSFLFSQSLSITVLVGVDF